MAKQVWFVGRQFQNYDDTWHWMIMGVFNTEKEAVAIVKDSMTFVGPIEFGVDLGPNPEMWLNAYYPMGAE